MNNETRIVYVIEESACGNTCVVGVASSPSAASDLLRKIYAAPYSVTWGELVKEKDNSWYSLAAEFDAVAGYSTMHATEFYITEMKVAEAS